MEIITGIKVLFICSFLLSMAAFSRSYSPKIESQEKSELNTAINSVLVYLKDSTTMLHKNSFVNIDQNICIDTLNNFTYGRSNTAFYNLFIDPNRKNEPCLKNKKFYKNLQELRRQKIQLDTQSFSL